MKSLISYKVEKIYKGYKAEIDETYQNCNISIHYYAFSKVIDSYPKLDFEDEAHSKIKNRCPWVPNHSHDWRWTQCCGCFEQAIEDDYGLLIEKLWTHLNVEEQKCACYVCTYRYNKCKKCPDCNDSDHTFSWDQLNCDKVIRQRLKQRPYRTCRFCQKDIPTDQFEKVEFVYNNSYDISLHLKPCSQKLDV